MSIIMVVLIGVVGVLDGTEAPKISGANPELSGYLIEASAQHPELEVRYAAWRAALERIPQATALDDPMFTYGQFLLSEQNRVKFNVSQKFPWFGTLRLRGDAAAIAAEAELARFYAARNAIFVEVKRAYHEYAFLAAQIEATESQMEVLDYMEQLLRSKYEFGLASENDLRRMQIEQAEVQDRLDGARALRPVLSSDLCERIGRPPGDLLPWPEASALPETQPTREAVHAAINENNPDLEALERMADTQAMQVELARKKGLPDFTLGLDYTSVSRARQVRPDRPYPASLQGARRLLGGGSDLTTNLLDAYAVGTYDEPMSYPGDAEDNLMISVQLNLPIWRKKIRAGVAEAELRAESAEHAQRRKALSLENAADRVLYRMADSRRRHELFESTLVPQAQAAYEGLLSSYSTGGAETSFLDVLESVRQLLDFNLEKIRTARDLHVAASELTYLVGGSTAEANDAPAAP